MQFVLYTTQVGLLSTSTDLEGFTKFSQNGRIWLSDRRSTNSSLFSAKLLFLLETLLPASHERYTHKETDLKHVHLNPPNYFYFFFFIFLYKNKNFFFWETMKIFFIFCKNLISNPFATPFTLISTQIYFIFLHFLVLHTRRQLFLIFFIIL